MGLSEREKQIARNAYCATPRSETFAQMYAAVSAVLAGREGALTDGIINGLRQVIYSAIERHRENAIIEEALSACVCQAVEIYLKAQRTPAPEQPTRFPRGIPAPYFEEDVEVKQPAAASDVVAEMLRAYDECTADKYAGMDGAIMGMTAALQVANKAWEKAIREEWDVCESQSDIDLGEYPDFIKRLQSRMGSAKC